MTPHPVKIQIRQALKNKLKVKDAARILLGSEPFLTYGFSLKTCQKLVQSKNIFLAQTKNQIVGFAIVETPFLNGSYLKLIAVDPRYRRQGIGHKLMEAIEKQTFKKYKALYLCVTDFNRAAQKFYKKRGFQKVGRLKDHIQKGIDEILLRKVKSSEIKLNYPE